MNPNFLQVGTERELYRTPPATRHFLRTTRYPQDAHMVAVHVWSGGDAYRSRVGRKEALSRMGPSLRYAAISLEHETPLSSGWQ